MSGVWALLAIFGVAAWLYVAILVVERFGFDTPMSRHDRAPIVNLAVMVPWLIALALCMLVAVSVRLTVPRDRINTQVFVSSEVTGE